MRRAALVAVALSFGLSSNAEAQPARPRRPQPVLSREEPIEEQKAPETRALRGRFGLDVAERLSRSTSAEDRLRAIARARSQDSPESVGFLMEQAARVTSGDGDGPIAIELARALDGYGTNERARAALYEIVVMPTRTVSRDALTLEDPIDADQRERARTMAAIALARTHEPRAFTLLSDAIRTNGPGARAAKIALFAHPPDKALFGASATVSPLALDYIVKSGDLRSIPAVLAMCDAGENATRIAALRALADLGDTRAIGLSTPLLTDEASELRVVATFVYVRLAAPDAEKKLLALLNDPLTMLDAIGMSEYVQSDVVTAQLASRALNPNDENVRLAAALALGRQRGELAARSLLTLSLNGPVTYEAAHALARSPSPVAIHAIEALLEPSPKEPHASEARRLGARAYLVRAIVRGERSSRAESVLAEMRKSTDVRDRAVAAEARVALGIEDAATAFDSPDVDVRRAATMGLFAKKTPESRALLARKLVKDEDATVRVLSTLSLLEDDEDAPKVTSTWLADRATSGGADAPLAALAFVRRADEKDLPKVDALLASSDFLLRAHAARGLATSSAKASVGRLARLYAYEPSAIVRRAAIVALAVRPEKTAPSYVTTLSEAATIDPDAEIRWLAATALRGQVPAAPPTSDALFIRVTSPGTPAQPMTAAFMRADGLAVPLTFDREGFALVPAIPPGEGRLFMTPTLP